MISNIWQSRPLLIVAGVLLFGALALFVIVLNNSLDFYYTPSDVHAGKAPTDESFSLGGLVRAGSLKREADGLSLRFVLTDNEKDVEVRFKGIPPDLFGEGRGAVVQGHLGDDGVFLAIRILAKHDENYLPPEHKR